MNIVDSTRHHESWLESQTNLQKSRLGKKNYKMACGAFPFLRATFYQWVQRWQKECSDLRERDQDVVLAMGDFHAENFGTWYDSRGRLVWGINDFDEACELPFTNDLVRLAASVVPAAEASKIEARTGQVCEAF